MNKHIQMLKYVLSDAIAAATAYTLFYLYRKKSIEPAKFGIDIPLEFDKNFLYYVLAIVVFWISLYTINGYYLEIFRKSRLKELLVTAGQSITGTLILFFLLFLDDQVKDYTNYYDIFFVYLGLHFTLTFTGRFLLTNATVKKIHRGEWGFRTLLVGSDQKAEQLYLEIINEKQNPGFKFVGFTHLSDQDNHLMKKHLPHLGNCVDLKKVVKQNAIEEVVIAVETKEHDQINKILNQLEGTGVYVKLKPDMYDFVSGTVKTSAIFASPLIEIKPFPMKPWERSVKRIMDIVLSLLFILIFAPLYIIIAIAVKLSSKGPVIFKQERIGLHGKPFIIYKFRSMYVDAEKNGPQLSSANDSRITPIGKILRKTRLDEIPQFFNVLKGDMSIVGPRPERQYFIDLITQRNPNYYHLLKVRPGITSWGQVKFGYAENVDQMIERMKYDILYVENMSILLDLKIMIYTILILLRLEGK